MDVIEIRGIRAHGKHGANPGERDRDQPFDVDIEIGIDLSRPAFSDVLADTVDYGELHETIVCIVRDRSFALLERLAAEILNAVFADERIARASVSIAKPNLLDGATPRVTLLRQRMNAEP
jgi:7,8-dihydroneopterin aldolase/epimerase/oxygenase